jgi:hypothetical protein
MKAWKWGKREGDDSGGMEMKMRERKWKDLTRDEKLANVMWPNLASAEIQKEMAEIAKGEGKKSPQQARLDEIAKFNRRMATK